MGNEAISFGLDREVVNSLSKVFERAKKVDEVIIFGSRAKGNFKDGSDIDLVIKGKDVQLDTILTLMERVEELGLLYSTDIQNYRTISDEDILEHIRRVGKVFWKRKKARQ